MIAPVALRDLVADTRIAATRDAVVATLGALLPGVTVVKHPGKLDINDVVARAVVAAPGIAVGYTRVRELGDPGGTFALAVDFAAYLVVEDWVDFDVAPPRTTPREVVGHAIGLQLLRVLRDPDAASWGLVAIEPPAMDPPPALVPLFTVKVEENMTATYAVTWTQALVQEGEPFFDRGGTPAFAAQALPAAGDGDDGIDFDRPPGPEDGWPPEVRANLRWDLP